MKLFNLVSCLAFSICTLIALPLHAEISRPNIIVLYTDDHGHADLSCQGVLDDIKTPHVDALAKNGVLMRNGYSTAPQCVPSRAGLLVGKFQSKFGVEANGYSLEGFNQELTIAERLQKAGYVTAQFGKWHLGENSKITDHGFKHVFSQNANRSFWSNITLAGEDRKMSQLSAEMYHVDGCSQAAASIIERYKDDPFFLYVAYRAPHVPLDATKKYLDRFPGKMPERRRQALAMLSAVDDGVGLITKTLAKHQLTEKTLIFYIGDNGAPLKIHKLDAPGGGPGWDGSLNDPLNGEKGMLSEGGMHVPFVVSWPGTIPGQQVYDHPVSALDVAATAAELAGLKVNDDELDGTNLIPHLTGKTDAPPHDALMWRWVSQSAIREGNWKLLRGGEREYLYDLKADIEEKMNLVVKHPEIADRLRSKLKDWTSTLTPPGLAVEKMSDVWNDYYDFYLEGKPAKPLRAKFVPKSKPKNSTEAKPIKGWIARNGELSLVEGALQVVSNNKKPPFLVRNGLKKIPGPLNAGIKLKSSEAGNVTIAWRTEDQKDFVDECQASVEINSSDDWQSYPLMLPIEGKLIHLRIVLPSGKTSVREIKLQSQDGNSYVVWE